MIIDIGNIFINQIKDLPWVDKYAGVVKVVSTKGENGASRSFPVACDSTDVGYKDLCPDSSKRSVLYLEDKGITPTDYDSAGRHLKASFDLIGWLNMQLLSFDGCSYSGTAIAGILTRLPLTPFNYGIYSRIVISFTGQYQKNANPFSKYTAYDETVKQFLLYPYDYFALSFEVDFVINNSCLAQP